MEPQKIQTQSKTIPGFSKQEADPQSELTESTPYLKLNVPVLSQDSVNLNDLASRKIRQKEYSNILDLKQRPQELKNAIDETFNVLKRTTTGGFRFFGEAANYNIAGLNAYGHIQCLLKCLPKEQTECVIVDLGAGLGGFGEGLLDYLSMEENPQNLKIHIISLTGEDRLNFETSKKGATHSYFGQFKAENFWDSLSKLDLKFDIKGKIDFLVSNYTLLHFHDPVGTLADIYNCLRPQTGMILSQGFNTVLYQGGHLVENPMETLLFLTGAPFLVCPSSSGYNEFLIRKPDDQRLALPLQYLSLESIKPAFGAEKNIATFEANSAITLPALKNVIHSGDSTSFYGDKNFFLWLAENNQQLKETVLHWESLLEYSVDEALDIVPKDNNIFYAIKKNDGLGLKNSLEAGEPVNQRNYEGIPLLSLAINRGLFKEIEPYKPSLSLTDPQGRIALMMAVQYNDMECLKYCATEEIINSQDKAGNTALHYFVSKRRPNLEALQYLIEKGADLTIANAEGNLPLHCLAQKSLPEAVANYLIKASRSVINYQNKEGNTPLHLAYICGQTRTQELLIQEGASKEILNNRGLFPDDCVP